MRKLEEVCLNLTPGEFGKASEWCNDLRESEKERVLKILSIFNEREFRLVRNKRTKFAIIVAGSSIDTEEYTDIDLFALSESSLCGDKYRADPKTVLGSSLGVNYVGDGEDARGDLPDNAYYIVYGETTCGIDSEKKKKMIEQGLGAVVTVSLFYEFKHGENRRADHPDDLLEPKEPMGAEELIEYNHNSGSKFLVLNRQYSPKAANR